MGIKQTSVSKIERSHERHADLYVSTLRRFIEAMGGQSKMLRRNNLSKQSDLDPVPAPNRYARRHGGELIHIDIKRLSRFAKPGHAVTGDRSKKTRKAGYDYLHVCIDSASRLGFAEIFPDQSALSAKQFLLNAIRHFKALGVVVKEVMTDNGGCYRAKVHKRLCHLLGLKHRRTRPYTPKTNGKAERFIQTLMRSWAYGRIYQTSEERNAALQPWLHYYNHERKHRGIDCLTPMTKLAQLQAVETEQCGWYLQLDCHRNLEINKISGA